MMYSISYKSTNIKIQSSTRYVTGYVQRFQLTPQPLQLRRIQFDSAFADLRRLAVMRRRKSVLVGPGE